MIRALIIAATVAFAAPALANDAATDRKHLMAFVNVSIADAYCGIEPDNIVMDAFLEMAGRYNIDPMVMARKVDEVALRLARTYNEEQVMAICGKVQRAYNEYGKGR